MGDRAEAGVLPPVKEEKSLDQRVLLIELIETPSGSSPQETKQRQDAIKEADAVIICLSAADATSLNNVGAWLQEVKSCSQSAASEDKESPVVCLVSTKSDLGGLSLSSLEGACREHKLAGAFETSAKEWSQFSVHRAVNGVAELA